MELRESLVKILEGKTMDVLEKELKEVQGLVRCNYKKLMNKEIDREMFEMANKSYEAMILAYKEAMGIEDFEKANKEVGSTKKSVTNTKTRTIEHVEENINECEENIKFYCNQRREKIEKGELYFEEGKIKKEVEELENLKKELAQMKGIEYEEEDKIVEDTQKKEEIEEDQYNLFDIIDKNLQEKEQTMGSCKTINNIHYSMKEVTREQTKPFILDMHYAKRMPPISFAYGLYKEGELIGVTTFGKPCRGVLFNLLGEEHVNAVWELNRLITIDNLDKNVLSWFVGQVLKEMKKKNVVLVSYADSEAGHCGYIYQATNWLYTGTTRKNSYDYYVPNGGHSRGYTQEMKEKYNHLRVLRSMKYRYIYFACNKTLKKKYMKALNYPIIKEYPKEENKNYVLGTKIKRRIHNRETGEIYLE